MPSTTGNGRASPLELGIGQVPHERVPVRQYRQQRCHLLDVDRGELQVVLNDVAAVVDQIGQLDRLYRANLHALA